MCKLQLFLPLLLPLSFVCVNYTWNKTQKEKIIKFHKSNKLTFFFSFRINGRYQPNLSLIWTYTEKVLSLLTTKRHPGLKDSLSMSSNSPLAFAPLSLCSSLGFSQLPLAPLCSIYSYLSVSGISKSMVQRKLFKFLLDKYLRRKAYIC